MPTLAAYSVGGSSAAGLVGYGLHAYSSGGGTLNDRIYAGDRVNNSIKYASPLLSGVTFGAMYGLGEVAGSIQAGRSISARVGYDSGPLSTGFSYFDTKNATETQSTRIYGLGASYKLARTRFFGLATQAKLSADKETKATTYEAGMNYTITPAIDLSGSYQHQSRNNGLGSARQITLVADYAFSKRTDVYTSVGYVKDEAFHAQAVAGVGNPSASDKQSVIRLGIRHIF